MSKLDVCGLNCPEPVLLVKREMVSGEKEIEVISDAAVAVENIARLCSKMGYEMKQSQEDGLWKLALTRKTS